MQTFSLIPYAEPIPAPIEILVLFEQLFFLIHIILINLILGLGLILLYKWNRETNFFLTNKLIAKKIPILFAIGINMAIPALLFLQVTFGHLFYTSSILMGTFWILIIPFLIVAYYSSYVHYKNFDISPIAKYALSLMIIMVLYIAFMLVNNLSMMELPEKWNAYFTNRDGTILLWSLPSLYPRYLHFIVASVAVGGIFYSLYFSKKDQTKKQEGLTIFAYATMVQILVGIWFLISLPKDIMLKFMGGETIATAILLLGIFAAIVSLVFALRTNIKISLLFLILTLISMVINRYNLRIFHLEDNFRLSQLNLVPQWDVFTIFIIILFLGIAVIIYMLKISFNKTNEVKK